MNVQNLKTVKELRAYLSAILALYTGARKDFKTAPTVVKTCRKYLRRAVLKKTEVDAIACEIVSILQPDLSDLFMEPPVASPEGATPLPKHMWWYDVDEGSFTKLSPVETSLEIITWPFLNYVIAEIPSGELRIFNSEDMQISYEEAPCVQAMQRKLLELDIEAQAKKVASIERGIRESLARLQRETITLESLRAGNVTSPYKPRLEYSKL